VSSRVPSTRWPVAGGRWPVAGGRWPVAGGRWPVAGGRWPVAGGRWPVPRYVGINPALREVSALREVLRLEVACARLCPRVFRVEVEVEVEGGWVGGFGAPGWRGQGGATGPGVNERTEERSEEAKGGTLDDFFACIDLASAVWSPPRRQVPRYAGINPALREVSTPRLEVPPPRVVEPGPWS
jgi:hypothetical protein